MCALDDQQKRGERNANLWYCTRRGKPQGDENALNNNKGKYSCYTSVRKKGRQKKGGKGFAK